MIFDLHTDILFDLVKQRQKGNKDCFNERHGSKLRQGGVEAFVAAYYSTSAETPFPLVDVLETLKELQNESNFRFLSKEFNPFKTSQIGGLAALEGLASLHHLEDLRQLLDAGIRMVSLTWNEENEWATGAKCDTFRGLTAKGFELIEFLNQRPVIIDISHANEKTAHQLIAYTTGPILASHSNAAGVLAHRRNVSDEIIQKIAARDGVIGLNAYPYFLTGKATATIDDLLHHLRYIIDLVGLRHVAFGFDFMDFLDEEEPTVQGLAHAGQLPHLIQALFNDGFSEEDILQMTYLNAWRVIKQVL